MYLWEFKLELGQSYVKRKKLETDEDQINKGDRVGGGGGGGGVE